MRALPWFEDVVRVAVLVFWGNGVQRHFQQYFSYIVAVGFLCSVFIKWVWSRLYVFLPQFCSFYLFTWLLITFRYPLVLLIKTVPFVCKGRRGCDRMVVVQSVPITTKVVSSNPVNDGMYSIQSYVINFISDLQKVGGILLKVALNTINPNSTFWFYL